MLGGVGAGFADGCGGIADRRRLVRGHGDVGAAFHGRAARKAFFAGQVAGQALQGKIFLERMVGIAVPHEDAAQIGMAVKLDSHHVEDFALVPVGALENRQDGIDGGFILTDFDFHAQVRRMVLVAERAEFIDDFVARFVAEVVDARDVDEEVVAKLVFEMGGGGADDAAVDLDGLVATNTTLARPGSFASVNEAGGLSGAPVRRRSTEIINYVARATNGRLPIIGVGGITDAVSAGEKLDAGATLVQVYTGMIYRGPFFPAALARALADRQKW